MRDIRRSGRPERRITRAQERDPRGPPRGLTRGPVSTVTAEAPTAFSSADGRCDVAVLLSSGHHVLGDQVGQVTGADRPRRALAVRVGEPPGPGPYVYWLPRATASSRGARTADGFGDCHHRASDRPAGSAPRRWRRKSSTRPMTAGSASPPAAASTSSANARFGKLADRTRGRGVRRPSPRRPGADRDRPGSPARVGHADRARAGFLAHRVITSQRWEKSSTGDQQTAGFGGHDDNLECQRVGDPEPAAVAEVEDQAPPLIDRGFLAVAEAAKVAAAQAVGGPTHAAEANPRRPPLVVPVQPRMETAEVQPTLGEPGCRSGSTAAARPRR